MAGWLYVLFMCVCVCVILVCMSSVYLFMYTYGVYLRDMFPITRLSQLRVRRLRVKRQPDATRLVIVSVKDVWRLAAASHTQSSHTHSFERWVMGNMPRGVCVCV